MAYIQLILWATETALFQQNLCIYRLIYPSIECYQSSYQST